MSPLPARRIGYLDFVRGIAILLMIMQRSILVLAKNAGSGHGILAQTFLVQGTAPAAPVFLLIMGIFLQNPMRMLKPALCVAYAYLFVDMH